ncbi:glycosyltransferase family 2 protein [Vibrio atlanticus]|uniref:glycosyltransferase family 2 protein n=1 Tax=Vibrio atlanticus TaxID=693153 RepID=UPI00354DE7F1
MSDSPLISVILPVYNCEKYIKDSVTSIIRQTYKNFELIIIDDGSTDDTLKILSNFSDERIKIVTRENKGLIFSLNEGVSLSKGDYIARMDADDISDPERLEGQLRFLEKNKDIQIVGSSIHIIDEDGIEGSSLYYKLSPFWVKLRLLFDSCLCHPSILARRKVFNIVEYDDEYKYAEDFKLWSEVVFNKGLNIQSLKNIYLKYRVHSGSVSVGDFEKQLTTSNRIIRENFSYLEVTVTEEQVKSVQLLYRRLKPIPVTDFFSLTFSLIKQMSVANFIYLFAYLLVLTKCNVKGWFNG